MQILGPLFLILAFALGGKNYELVAIAILGLIATTKWRLRGWAYTMALLAIVAAWKHLGPLESHLTQATLEGAIGCSLLLCALIQEQQERLSASLQQLSASQLQSIANLEDELGQCKEAALVQKSAWAETRENLQSQIEETQNDFADIQILNEVLRKTSASALEEKGGLCTELFEAQRKEVARLEEIDALQKELKRLSDESALANQNRELFAELNAARCKEMQTHLVNETLVRLHAQESRRVKELEAERTEALLYRQLQRQFEEKSEVLHQTRSQLFLADTQLQTLKVQMEQRQLTADPLATSLCTDLEGVEKENGALAQENGALQALVTHLMAETGKAVKKRGAKPPEPAEQSTLF